MAAKFPNQTVEKKLTAKQMEKVNAMLQRGLNLHQQGKIEQALMVYQGVLEKAPRHFDALYLLGVVCHQVGNPGRAIQLLCEAIEVNPSVAMAHCSLGNAYLDSGLIMEAVESYNEALKLNPEYVEAHNNRGTALQSVMRLYEALNSYDRALAVMPDDAEVNANRGAVLALLGRLDESLDNYNRAIAAKPDFVEFHKNRGNVLSMLNRPAEALESYLKLLQKNPDYELLLGDFLHAKMMICDWSDFAVFADRLEASIVLGKKLSAPFCAIGVLDRPDLHMRLARMAVETQYPRSYFLGEFEVRPADGKIRIGYYSADFHDHATAYLIAELLESHDPSRFEVYGFSYGHIRQGEMRERIVASCVQFFELATMTDREVALLSRKLGIDIAVDLKGFTTNARTGILAEGCAPIQVNYLGYPGTMAAEYIDYIVADQTIVPEGSHLYYTEKIVYMPYSYQVNDSKRKISDRVYSRQELGLPDQGFVFCCFNNTYKILPSTFDCWMRLLQAVEGSVLWLLESNPTAPHNLRREAEARGVDPGRLVFAKPMPLAEHLARHRAADLFLDTFPCNAHTTASDALWAGLPLLTRVGRSFASRVAASLLNALGLPELITNSIEEYEARALTLATDPGALSELKHKLEANKAKSPLFSGKVYARQIETAYQSMYARYQAGYPPISMVVSEKM